MLSLPHTYSKAPAIPYGFFLETQIPPSPQALNRLLSKCNFETHPPQKLALAFKKSDYNLSLFSRIDGNLAGFVRVTSDRGLNANLWDLVAEPGDLQESLLFVLVNRALRMIKQDMPGCSISVAAPEVTIKALKGQGFLLDPGGIRTMGFRI